AERFPPQPESARQPPANQSCQSYAARTSAEQAQKANAIIAAPDWQWNKRLISWHPNTLLRSRLRRGTWRDLAKGLLVMTSKISPKVPCLPGRAGGPPRWVRVVTLQQCTARFYCEGAEPKFDTFAIFHASRNLGSDVPRSNSPGSSCG